MQKVRYFLLAFGLLFLAAPALCQSTTADGIAMYRASRYDEAATTLRSITSVDKKDRFAWVYLGASLIKAGHARNAVTAFRKGRAKVEELVPGDDAPVTNFSKPRPRYTEMGRQNLTSGIVRLAVELTDDGKIGSIWPVDTLPDGLTEQSIAAARSIIFTPAQKNGKPVTTVAIVEYTFDVR